MEPIRFRNKWFIEISDYLYIKVLKKAEFGRTNKSDNRIFLPIKHLLRNHAFSELKFYLTIKDLEELCVDSFKNYNETYYKQYYGDRIYYSSKEGCVLHGDDVLMQIISDDKQYIKYLLEVVELINSKYDYRFHSFNTHHDYIYRTI